ncbi:MAG: amino acid permease [Gammaproteobacteria bacterium]|nr:amino acid permease [Gammaproteobacteria bacterium]NNM13684.1 amino acid permease [Gammaproteobacteria bacterium]
MRTASKKLGFWMCVSLVVGNMVGSGIFLLPSSLAEYGGISIIGWIVTAFGALMTALVFVRLSRKMPAQGGPYAYTRKGFGDVAGFTVAWGYWVSLWCGNAAISVAMVSYLSYFFPQLSETPLLGVVVALAAIWTLTLVNCRGVRHAGYVQVITTVLKLTPLIIIGIAVFLYFDVSQFEPLNKSEKTTFNAVTATAALTLWAFLGLESATIPADNVEDPVKTIPRATLLGFLIAAVVYISSTTTILSVIPHVDLVSSNAPFADAAKILWGEWAGTLVAVGAVISCFGALNGWILLQGQMPMAAAHDGLLPAVFKGNAHGVPVKGLLISSGFVSFIAISNYTDGLVALFTFSILLATLMVLVPYLFTALYELKLIISKQTIAKDWLALLTTILAMVYTLWAISGIGKDALLVGIGLILSGLPVYWWMRKRRLSS